MNDKISSINLKKQILSGTFWSTGGQITTAALRFGSMLVLAHLLPVEVFGLLGMALVVMLILQDVSDMGLGAALVQRESIDDTDLATIFWFNLGISLLITVLLFAGSNYLAYLLGDTRLETILKALSLLLPINALTVVPQAVMRRNLMFAQLSQRDVWGMIGFGLVGIPMAILQLGIWSLVGALATQWVFRAGLIWFASPYRPKLKFSWRRLHTLSGFSTWMFVSILMGRMMANIDYFIIGRFLGASALGYYTLAFQLVIIPNQRISGMLGAVLFPSFSRIQNQTKRLQNGFLKTVRYLALVLIPISTFLFISADSLVPFLYSVKWLPAVPVVRLLALASVFYSLDIMNSLLNAIGKPNWRVLILGFRATTFVLLAWIFGLKQGIEGVAISILIAVAVSSLLQIWVLARVLRVTLSAVWRSIRSPLLSAILITFIGWELTTLLVDQQDGAKVIALAVVMGLGYSALVIPGYYKELFELAHYIGLNRRILTNNFGKVK